MIRPLRRGHVWLVGGVGAVVAPLYLAALAARPAPPVQQSLPAALAAPVAAATGGGTVLPTTPPIRVRPAGDGALLVEPDGVVEGADLLLYWAPAGSSPSPAEAYLLGALGGGERQRLELPAAAAGAPGVLLLYSLGHGEPVASAPWPTAGEGRP